jgi:Spy/CpxP family protein refolding chaperone
MKLKILIGILVFIVIVNIVTVDTYLYYHLVGKSIEYSDNKSLDRTIGSKQVDDPLTTLNDVQRNKLREIIEEFRKSTGELNGRIRILDDEIIKLIQAESVQKDRIDQNLKEISSLRLEISKIAIDKIIRTKSFLSKEQQEQLFGAIFRVKPSGQAPQKANNSPREKKSQEMRDSHSVRPDNKTPPKENRLRKLSEKLELTKEQITQLDAILGLSEKKYSSLGAKDISDPVQYKQERKAIMDEEDAQIAKILTDAQKKKFTEMKMKPERGPSKKDQKERPPRN